MDWTILLDDEFAPWLTEQTAPVRIEMVSCIGLLRERGPHLGRPLCR